MNLSPSIAIIWRLAANEMAAGEFKEIQPEHFYIAVLKFAEVSIKAHEEAGEEAALARLITGEAQLVRDALEKCGIECKATRRKLRRQMGKGDTPFKGEDIHRSPASRALFESAAALTAESGSDTLAPQHLLAALLQSPTPAIAKAVLGKTPAPPLPPVPSLLEKHGQDLVKQAADGKIAVKTGFEAQSKAVLQVLQQKNRRCVLLVSDSDALVTDLSVVMAGAVAANDAPEGLHGRRLMDISTTNGAEASKRMRPFSGQELAVDVDRMRLLLAEAASCPEVIVLIPAVEAEPMEAVHRGQWTSLLTETLTKGKVQFICRVSPSVFTEHLRKDPVWKRKTHAVWLEKATPGSVPKEL